MTRIVWWITCLIWSTVWLAIKVGVRDVPPISFAGLRLVVALVVLAPVLIVRRDLLRRMIENWKLIAGTGVLLLGVNYALVFWGAQYVSSGLIAVLQSVTPAFGVWLSHVFMREPIRPAHIVGTLIGMAGLAILFGEHLHLSGSRGLLGALAIACGALFVALAYVIVAASGRKLPPLSVTTGQMIAGAIPLLVTGAMFEGNPLAFHWTRASIAALLYLAIAGSVAGFWLNYWLLPRVGATSVLTMSIVEPLFAVLLGALVLHEALSWRVALGGICVLVSATMILWPKRAR